MSDIDDIIMGGMVFKGGGGPKKDDDDKVKTKARRRSTSRVLTEAALPVRRQSIANREPTANHRRRSNSFLQRIKNKSPSTGAVQSMGIFSYFRHQSSLSLIPCQVETRSPETAMVGV